MKFKKENMKNVYVGLAIVALSFTACEKKQIDNETQSAKDNATSEMKFAEITDIMNNIGLDEDGTEKDVLGLCATIAIEEDQSSSDGFPKVYTVDWGTGCTDDDGRSRSGILEVTITKAWTEVGSHLTFKFMDFFSNGAKYEGVLTMEKTAEDADGNMTIDVELANGKLTWQTSDGEDVVEYSFTRTITQTAGGATVEIDDDIFEIAGQGLGISREGLGFTITISASEPLVLDMSCSYIKSGVIVLIPDGLSARHIDFGDGTCDDKATITIVENGSTQEFTLP